jgi:hypothetical protein
MYVCMYVCMARDSWHSSTFKAKAFFIRSHLINDIADIIIKNVNNKQ